MDMDAVKVVLIETPKKVKQSCYFSSYVSCVCEAWNASNLLLEEGGGGVQLQMGYDGQGMDWMFGERP